MRSNAWGAPIAKGWVAENLAGGFHLAVVVVVVVVKKRVPIADVFYYNH